MNGRPAMARNRRLWDGFSRIPAAIVLAGGVFLFLVGSRSWADVCEQPGPVCAARAAVFAVSSFDPVASAVRIAPNTLVTSRHAIADEAEVTVFAAEGQPLPATVLPSDYPGDLVLLSVPGLPPGPVMEVSADSKPDVGELVYSVGADVSKGAIRAYSGGAVLMPPAADRPLARLHHMAYSQPGNSGGALVSGEGRLVGIIASGGEGRYEAVPVIAVAELQTRSGAGFAEASKAIGKAVRDCTLLLEDRRGKRAPLTDAEAESIESACMATENRQYFDLAAQTFGGSGMLGRSFEASKASLEQDPNSLNARLTAAINYHLARWYEEEIPHLRFLMQHIPDDPQVIRLGIQAGVWGGDADLAAAAFDRLKASNPNMVAAAQKFLENPPPRAPRMELPQ